MEDIGTLLQSDPWLMKLNYDYMRKCSLANENEDNLSIAKPAETHFARQPPPVAQF